MAVKKLMNSDVILPYNYSGGYNVIIYQSKTSLDWIYSGLYNYGFNNVECNNIISDIICKGYTLLCFVDNEEGKIEAEKLVDELRKVEGHIECIYIKSDKQQEKQEQENDVLNNLKKALEKIKENLKNEGYT